MTILKAFQKQLGNNLSVFVLKANMAIASCGAKLKPSLLFFTYTNPYSSHLQFMNLSLEIILIIKE